MKTLHNSPVRLIASVRNWIEAEAIRQLYAAARLHGVQLAVGLPDLHPGKGTPVGAAFVSQAMLYPQLLGSDVGCGMGLWRTNLPRLAIPIEHWNQLRFDLEHPWGGNIDQWLRAAQLPRTCYDNVLGTLGDGNHFAELQAIDSVHDPGLVASLGLHPDRLTLLVHSGSRGLGEAVWRSYLADHGPNGAQENSEAAQAYLKGHHLAVRWARSNRTLIARRFLDTLQADGTPVLDSCHNRVCRMKLKGRMVWVHRKGAVSAADGPVVIAGSRGTRSYLVVPQEQAADVAWSLAHGAGRKWSRSESKARMRARYRPAELLRTPLGGRVVCANRSLLYEEAPSAYKPIEVIIQDMVEAGLVRVAATLQPVFTYKTSTTPNGKRRVDAFKPLQQAAR